MSNSFAYRFCVSLLVSVFCITSLANSANALMGSESVQLPSDKTFNYIARVPAVCDISKENYGYSCSVGEIQAVLQPLEARLASVKTKYDSLVSSNVELLCEPEIGEDGDAFEMDPMYGPCLNYSDWNSKIHSLFFPCSNPNSRFEQAFPTEYWSGYYESVNKSQDYGGCPSRFASNVGLSIKFRNTWQSRWALIFPTYKSLVVDYDDLQENIKTVTYELEKAKRIPANKPGDCQLDPSDPTEGFIAKGKTVVNRYGYKFTCKNSVIRRTGRVIQKAAILQCPEYDSPTGNTCSVTSTWGINSYLSRLPKYSPVGKVIDTGWFVSVTGYRCTVKLYANFAFRESCK
jgi:hypothetical protein